MTSIVVASGYRLRRSRAGVSSAWSPAPRWRWSRLASVPYLRSHLHHLPAGNEPTDPPGARFV